MLFDIPEKLRRLRDSLRLHFREIGFIELQNQFFIHPYSCDKEIEFIIEFYNARKYVRFILAENIDNELDLKKKFNLKSLNSNKIRSYLIAKYCYKIFLTSL